MKLEIKCGNTFPGSTRRCYSVESKSEMFEMSYDDLCLLKNIFYFTIFQTKQFENYIHRK